MAKRGLNKENIIDAAEELVVEKGYDNFSLREVATRLGVKPASLYNHVKGLEEINVGVALRAADKLKREIEEAVKDKEPDEALAESMRAYRRFAMQNPELYKAFVRIPLLNDKEVTHIGFRSFSPIREVIDSYGLTKRENIHYARELRAVMHGFIELTNNGFMQKKEVSQDESYEEIIADRVSVLKYKSRKAKESAL